MATRNKRTVHEIDCIRNDIVTDYLNGERNKQTLSSKYDLAINRVEDMLRAIEIYIIMQSQNGYRATPTPPPIPQNTHRQQPQPQQYQDPMETDTEEEVQLYDPLNPKEHHL